MKINIQLNQKSLKNAIKQLKQYQKRYEEAVKDFIEGICLWIIDRANLYLNASDIGENVKIDIRNGWEYEIKLSGAKLLNKTEQATYVEFGVGQVGAQNQHINAYKAGYQYNIGNKINREDDTWIFNVSSSDDIDIENNYILNKGTTSVRTKGQPAVMFAYNALIDIQVGDTLKNLWEQSKKRYLG